MLSSFSLILNILSFEIPRPQIKYRKKPKAGKVIRIKIHAIVASILRFSLKTKFNMVKKLVKYIIVTLISYQDMLNKKSPPINLIEFNRIKETNLACLFNKNKLKYI
jgi:hypothetical protein